MSRSSCNPPPYYLGTPPSIIDIEKNDHRGMRPPSNYILPTATPATGRIRGGVYLQQGIGTQRIAHSLPVADDACNSENQGPRDLTPTYCNNPTPAH